MGWRVIEELQEFDAAVRAALEADPVEQTVLATILAALAQGVRFDGGSALFVAHERRGAAIHTPPYGMHIAPGSLDLADLARLVRGHPLPGVNGAEPDALAFAGAWGPHRVAARHHLLVLGELTPPPAPAAGRVRALGPHDIDAAQELVDGFAAEEDEPPMSRARLATVLDAGRAYGWEVDGDVVCYVGCSPAVAGVARIAPVYTRPGHRRHGYAGAVTAAATQAALGRGAQRLCLFTDAANATSNGVYERLGYVREPRDRLVVEFD